MGNCGIFNLPRFVVGAVVGRAIVGRPRLWVPLVGGGGQPFNFNLNFKQHSRSLKLRIYSAPQLPRCVVHLELAPPQLYHPAVARAADRAHPEGHLRAVPDRTGLHRVGGAGLGAVRPRALLFFKKN